MIPSAIRVARLWIQKQAKNLPADVERDVQEGKDQGMDEGKAWAVAWSRYCKYKNPGSDHCQMDSGDYFQGRKAARRISGLEDAPATQRIEDSPTTPSDLLKAVVRYVASNKIFRIDSPETQRLLSKFTSNFRNVYRYWYNQPPNQTLEKLESVIVHRPFFSATQSLDTVADRLWPDKIGGDGVIVCKFSGEGFKPQELIRDLLSDPSVTIDPETRALAGRVQQDYGQEEEVCITRVTGRMVEVTDW